MEHIDSRFLKNWTGQRKKNICSYTVLFFPCGRIYSAYNSASYRDAHLVFRCIMLCVNYLYYRFL